MPKILIITDNLKTQINGVVTTFNQIEKQAEKNGYAIEFIDPSSFRNFSCPGYPEVKISIPWNIGKKILNSNPDYIHIATEGPIGVRARLWLNKKGWQYNTSYHTKFPEFLKEIYGIPESWTYAYVRWFHRDSAKVLTTTKTMVDDLKSHGFEGCLESWTRGVDKNDLKPTVEHVKNSSPNVLYAGRVSKEKNLESLLTLENKFSITVVGDGPDRTRLEKKYTNVNFVGYKKGSELADYYTKADVFAFPSCTDTFGIVMIEAISHGTPIAAYPVQGPIDVVEQGINGYLDTELSTAVALCLSLDRDSVQQSSKKWTWEECWRIFHANLIEKY